MGGGGGVDFGGGWTGARLLITGSFFSGMDVSGDVDILFWVIRPNTIVPVVNNNMLPGVNKVLLEPNVEFSHAVYATNQDSF